MPRVGHGERPVSTHSGHRLCEMRRRQCIPHRTFRKSTHESRNPGCGMVLASFSARLRKSYSVVGKQADCRRAALPFRIPMRAYEVGRKAGSQSPLPCEGSAAAEAGILGALTVSGKSTSSERSGNRRGRRDPRGRRSSPFPACASGLSRANRHGRWKCREFSRRSDDGICDGVCWVLGKFRPQAAIRPRHRAHRL